jgi:branched-chain amino acid transport system substrate-binding protein
MNIAEQKNRMVLISGAASLPITNERCNANTVHWVYDSYGLASGTAKAVVQSGKKNWYFIAADYTAGAAMTKDASQVVTNSGGKVLGVVKHPFPASDFSSFLVAAQSSKADVIALANGGQDTITAIKQAAEFGITGSSQTIVPIVLFITDVHALGLKTAQGLTLTEGFYWNRDEKTRAWSRRFFEKAKKMPSMAHAGVYSSVLNYLKAVEKSGTDDTGKVMATLKSTEIDDGLFKGTIRADGKFAHDMLLLEVKKPSEPKEPWDYYHVRKIIPAADAALPLAESKCKLVTR